MLQVRDLGFSYGDRQVLDGVGFGLGSGQLCALFGPNGSGKSTLFRCLLGHLPHRGSVSLDGLDLAKLSPSAVARRVAYVPQQHHQPFPFTVFDMVLMGRTPQLGGVFGPRTADLRVCEQVLDRVGLIAERNREFHTLSGGQRQLVLIARALAQDCDLLLLDEPTASLDYGNQVLVWRTLGELSAEGKTLLVCTHDPHHVRSFTDRALALGRDGRLCADGVSAEVITDDLVQRLYPDTGSA